MSERYGGKTVAAAYNDNTRCTPPNANEKLIPTPCPLIIRVLRTALSISFQNRQIGFIPPDAAEGLVAWREQRLGDRGPSLDTHRGISTLRDAGVPEGNELVTDHSIADDLVG